MFLCSMVWVCQLIRSLPDPAATRSLYMYLGRCVSIVFIMPFIFHFNTYSVTQMKIK